MRCHCCKKLGHIKPSCPKHKAKMEQEDRANEGAYTHVDVVLAMDEGVEVVMDRKHSKCCGVHMVQGRTNLKVACLPYGAPLMDPTKHPCMGPIGFDSDDENELADAKTNVVKNSKDMSCFHYVRCNITGHT